MKEEAREEAIEKCSYFEDAWVGATTYHSYAKEAREESRELHIKEYLKKIEELTSELEDRKIMEKHLKRENKMYKENNNNIVQENKKLNKQIKKLETQNILISKQAYRWLKEKKLWQYKYEKQKVKVAIYKVEEHEGIDILLQVA